MRDWHLVLIIGSLLAVAGCTQPEPAGKTEETQEAATLETVARPILQ